MNEANVTQRWIMTEARATWELAGEFLFVLICRGGFSKFVKIWEVFVRLSGGTA